VNGGEKTVETQPEQTDKDCETKVGKPELPLKLRNAHLLGPDFGRKQRLTPKYKQKAKRT